jgi:hypothetical protein
MAKKLGVKVAIELGFDIQEQVPPKPQIMKPQTLDKVIT